MNGWHEKELILKWQLLFFWLRKGRRGDAFLLCVTFFKQLQSVCLDQCIVVKDHSPQYPVLWEIFPVHLLHLLHAIDDETEAHRSLSTEKLRAVFEVVQQRVNRQLLVTHLVGTLFEKVEHTTFV